MQTANFVTVQIMFGGKSCISILWIANHTGHDASLTWIPFLIILGKRQTTVHLSGQVSAFQESSERKSRSNTECRLLTMGLKMWELRCWGCGAADEGCWWLVAPVGGVAGFCWRSSLGGGGSGRDGGWGSGTTKLKVEDKMFHNNNNTSSHKLRGTVKCSHLYSSRNALRFETYYVHPQNWLAGSMFLWNTGELLLSYTVFHSRSQNSEYLLQIYS
jgi:hypothetical protein